MENVIKFSFGVTPTAPNTSRWPMSPSIVNSAKRNKDKPTAYVSSFSIFNFQLVANPSKYSAFNALSDYITNKQNLADFPNEHFWAVIPRNSDLISVLRFIYASSVMHYDHCKARRNSKRASRQYIKCLKSIPICRLKRQKQAKSPLKPTPSPPHKPPAPLYFSSRACSTDSSGGFRRCGG